MVHLLTQRGRVAYTAESALDAPRHGKFRHPRLLWVWGGLVPAHDGGVRGPARGELREVDGTLPDVGDVEHREDPGLVLLEVAGVPAQERVVRVDGRDPRVRGVPRAREL